MYSSEKEHKLIAIAEVVVSGAKESIELFKAGNYIAMEALRYRQEMTISINAF